MTAPHPSPSRVVEGIVLKMLPSSMLPPAGVLLRTESTDHDDAVSIKTTSALKPTSRHCVMFSELDIFGPDVELRFYCASKESIQLKCQGLPPSEPLS